jgi:hypothetical protein
LAKHTEGGRGGESKGEKGRWKREGDRGERESKSKEEIKMKRTFKKEMVTTSQ